MNTPLKTPKKGAVAKFRDFYTQLRNRSVSPELLETLKKKEKPTEDRSNQKKIARPDRDAELP